MNVIIIAALVLIIILVIYIASIVFGLDYLIREAESLNLGSGKTASGSSGATDAKMKTIAASALDRPGSSRYYYSGWFFIDSNITKDNKENVLFNRGKEFIVSLNKSKLNIYAGITNDVSNSGIAVGTFDPSTNKPVVSVPNFPFQKWAQLVINVEGTTVDVYIDGKFVVSATAPNVIRSTSTIDITYGNQYTQGQITRFSRPGVNISPQGVWSLYMQGSGQGYSYSSTGLKMQITKNGQTKYNQTLL